MKKRLLAALVILCLSLSLLPMAALADEGEPAAAEPDTTIEPEAAAELETTAQPEATAAPLDGSGEDVAVAAVQPLIDALPDADTITAGSYDAVAAQLDAIDEAKLSLTTEQRDSLDFSRYNAAIAALEALDGMTGASEPATTGDLSGNLSSQTWSDGEYKLTGDVSLNKACTITVTGTVTLDLNSRTLKYDQTSTTGDSSYYIASMIVVQSGASLTIIDSSGTGAGKIEAVMQKGADDYACIKVEAGGTLNLQSGTITGNVYGVGKHTAGGVYVAGTFNMSGGKIADCYNSTATSHSALGVYVASGGVFNMSSGTISSRYSNAAQYSAGGVCVDGGTFTMSGGSISGFSTSMGESAGGVCVNSGTFNFSGGSITSCTANTTGDHSAGGVCVRGGTFNLCGGAISYCTTTGSGGYSAGGFYAGGCTATMTSGSIISCSSYSSNTAGGVYVGNTGSFTQSGGAMQNCMHYVASGATDNSSYSGAGGVYVSSGGAYTLSGSSSLSACCASNQDNGKALNVYVAAGGVYVASGGTFTITDGRISLCLLYYLPQKENETNNYPMDSGLVNNGTVYANGGTVVGLANNGRINTTGTGATTFSLETITYLFPATLLNNLSGVINGGTFNYHLQNSGTIDSGRFTQKVTNYGTISGGSFTGNVTNTSGTVKGGDFSNATSRTNVCQISFDLSGGDGTVPATQWRYNWPVTKPDDPTRTGYRFLGWYNGEEKWDFETNVTSATDITLTAKWQELDPATVTTAPTANTLTYTGAAQALVAAGTATNGTMMYCLTESGTYTAAIPTAQDADTYTVWYYAQGDGVNYSDSAKGFVSVTIGQKAVTVSGIKAEDKTYDGTANATLDCSKATITGVVDGDTVSVTATGAFADKNAGTGKTVTIANLTLTGADANNYKLAETGQQTTATANISQKSVTATVSVETKTYDGSTTATVTVKAETGVLSGDNITVTGVTGSFADANVGTNKSVSINSSSAQFTGSGAGNYSVTIPASATGTIEQKSLTPTVTVAAGTYTYNGAEHRPVVTVKDVETVIPAGEYEVTYSNNTNAGTATVTVTNKSGGNYAITTATETFTIAKRAVTLTSADSAKPYDGTALTNGDKTVTVSGEGMVAGEAFDFAFTASQTEIGSADNTFTVQETATAKTANYTITPVYGTLTVTVPADVANAVEGITPDNVTSADRESIEQTLDTVEDYLDMSPSDEEKRQLEALEDTLEELLDRLDSLEDAMDDNTIFRVEDITAENASSSDKKKLEAAKDAIEEILDDFSGNLTEDEKAELEQALSRIESALAAIEQAEQAKRQAVKTGDAAMPMLWLALAATATALLLIRKKKKQ